MLESQRDLARRICWIACTIDALGAAMTGRSENPLYSMQDYGEMLRVLAAEIKAKAFDIIDTN